MGLSLTVYRLFEVIVEMLRPVPPPVMIPVAMLFFGLEDEMKIFVIFFSCAWPILLNTLDGARNVDRVLLNTARTFGLSQWKIIWNVILPAASPQIVTGIESQPADHAHPRRHLRDGREHRRDRLLYSRFAASIQSSADVCGDVYPGDSRLHAQSTV